jgi:hypothetical protein
MKTMMVIAGIGLTAENARDWALVLTKLLTKLLASVRKQRTGALTHAGRFAWGVVARENLVEWQSR